MPRWNGDQPGAEGCRASRRVPAAAARSSELAWAIIAQSRKRGALRRATERARAARRARRSRRSPAHRRPRNGRVRAIPCGTVGFLPTPPPRLFSRRLTLRNRASPLQGGEPSLDDSPGTAVKASPLQVVGQGSSASRTSRQGGEAGLGGESQKGHATPGVHGQAAMSSLEDESRGRVDLAGASSSLK